MRKFKVLSTDQNCSARRAALTTNHGQIQTPAFMPVGTSGAVKGITPQQLEQTGAEIVLANTYHLMLRPGIECIESIGGLHRFMAWAGPILTDSGGYQVFSLSRLTQINDDGVEFASHIDGAKVYLNAEITTNIQNRLGADIIMCLDQCTAFGCDRTQLQKAVERTIRWAGRAKQAHSNRNQLLFGIVQGGTDPELRGLCASQLVKMDFDGYAIGGLSVGESREDMIGTVSLTIGLLPQDKPRYLMGVGTPADIIAAVQAGVDMFDCVLPTRNGRNALAFTKAGPVRMRNTAHTNDAGPIESNCDCLCCRNFTRAAVRHFFNVAEMLGPILVSIHNLRFYQRLMAEIRHVIEKNEFDRWAKQQLRETPFRSTSQNGNSKNDD